MHDGTGKCFGYVEDINVQNNRLTVVGWALSERVGLKGVSHEVDCKPDLAREDVLERHRDAINKRPGFALNSPLGDAPAVFWAEMDSIRFIYALPPIFPGASRVMRLRLVVPFLRDATRAIPAALHWLIYRDSPSVAAIRSAFGLHPLNQVNRLDPELFTQSSNSSDVPANTSTRNGITIILPVYNGFELLNEAMQRILANTDLPWRLIVIEDCSSDDRVRPWLRDWHSQLPDEIAAQVRLIENSENMGFVRSVNLGFTEAVPFGDDVVLLNSDAFVPPAWASRLLRPLRKLDQVATVTPMSNDAEIFNVPHICQQSQLQPGEADEIDRIAARLCSPASLADAPVGVGFCMAMNITYLRELPQLDTIFGRGYGEEVDWCRRATRLGGRHLGLGSLFVEHRGGSSFGCTEKQRLLRENSKIITRRYPHYDAEVQTFIGLDPLKSVRLALAIAWAGARQKTPVSVYLAHDLGGGAELYLQNRLAAELQQKAAVIVLRVGGQSRWQVEFRSASGMMRGETDDTELVRHLLAILPNRHLIFSCGVGDPDPLSLPDVFQSFASAPDDRISVLMHDYLALSPSYTLLDFDGVYRGVPMPHLTNDPAHSSAGADGTSVSLAEWRSAWGGLMHAAHNIIVFSENSRKLVALAYPDIAGKLTITPHMLINKIPAVTPLRPKDGIPVIGVLGNIGFQKGITVLADLSQHLAESGRARLVVIGNTDPNYPLASSAIIHGTYEPHDIAALVARYGISCWLIPSISPETFSYTTHEALATGLPVWSFDLGAQGDAVRIAAERSAQGGTLPLTGNCADSKAMLDAMLPNENRKCYAA